MPLNKIILQVQADLMLLIECHAIVHKLREKWKSDDREQTKQDQHINQQAPLVQESHTAQTRVCQSHKSILRN